MALVSGGLGWFVPQVVAQLSPTDQERMTGYLRNSLGGHPDFAVFGVIENDRALRVSVLNPTGLRTVLPGDYDELTQEAQYGPDCLAAWHIMLLARPHMAMTLATPTTASGASPSRWSLERPGPARWKPA